MKNIHLFVHVNDAANKQQKVCLLTLEGNKLPKMEMILDLKQ